MSSSLHVDHQEKDTLILGEGPTQVVDDNTTSITLTEEATFTGTTPIQP